MLLDRAPNRQSPGPIGRRHPLPFGEPPKWVAGRLALTGAVISCHRTARPRYSTRLSGHSHTTQPCLAPLRSSGSPVPFGRTVSRGASPIVASHPLTLQAEDTLQLGRARRSARRARECVGRARRDYSEMWASSRSETCGSRYTRRDDWPALAPRAFLRRCLRAEDNRDSQSVLRRHSCSRAEGHISFDTRTRDVFHCFRCITRTWGACPNEPRP